MSYRRSKNSNSTVFSTFPSKRNRNKFGLCPTCKRSNTNPDWCQICNSERFRQQFCHWTSGSKLIDDFIKDTQLSATNNRQILEWIPYSQFNILKFAATGGFASVYSAIWRDGFITKWNYKESKWERRSRWGVALKVLNDSAELASAFLEEVKACVKCGGGFGLIRCYGLSQDPTTKNFIIVLYHAHHGSLKSYLGQHYGELDWTYKLGILNQIAEGLKKIHQAGLVHKDFHSGNILLSNYAEIADLGFTGPVSKKDLSTSTTSKHKHVVYGVLPYISPEVLRGIKYDYVADVYSFGIVMWEVATCLPPFNDRAHDAYLALDICLGLRPNVEDYIPEPFVKLMTRCWDAKPSSRPSAHDIYQTLHTWYWNLKDGDGNAVTKSFINADSNDFQSSTPASSRPVTQTHPLAVYTSRLLNFHDLPEPVNALHTTGRRIPITSSVDIVSNDSLEEYRTRQLDDELSFENCFSDRIETVTLSEVTVVSEKEEQYVSRQVNGGISLGRSINCDD